MASTENAMDAIRRVTSAHSNERLEPCGISAIVIGEDVLGEVPTHLARLVEDRAITGRRLLFIVDRTPIMRRGVEAKDHVRSLLREHFDVTTLVLDDGHPELHASEDVVAEAAAAAHGFDAVLTLGGGTITDIGKMASARVGNPPLVAVQTAASVDGYTDDVSVLLKNGVKRTVPSRWPDVVIADTVLIAEAPSRMNRAGYGEINSMFVAPADWLLAKKLGFDDGFSRGPVALLQEVGAGIEEWAPGLADAQFDSVAQLVRALDIRGVATGVAGSTALLSGVEHLVSHMLDMANAAAHRNIGLHGAQVGVASVVAAVIWEELFGRLDEAHVNGLDMPAVDAAAYEERVRATFSQLDADGAIAAECWRDFGRKLARWQAQRDAVGELIAAWPSHRDDFRALVMAPEQIARGLIVAGSPATFSDLDPSIDGELAFWAVRNCAMMRNRLTALDVLDFLGWWDDDVAARVIATATSFAAIGAGR